MTPNRKVVPRVVVRLAGRSDASSMETLRKILQETPAAVWGEYRGHTPLTKAAEFGDGPAAAMCAKAAATLSGERWVRWARWVRLFGIPRGESRK